MQSESIVLCGTRPEPRNTLLIKAMEVEESKGRLHVEPDYFLDWEGMM